MTSIHSSLKIVTESCTRFWHWATPFWLFRDASRGTAEQRIANYRYNRSQREILHAYTLKWMAIAGLMMLILRAYSGAFTPLNEGTPAYFCAALFCVGSGIGFSIAMVIIAILLASYFYLSHVKR